jgi:hypothetical protein
MKPTPPPIRYRTRTLKSEGRLERLITERLLPGADQALIDRRIWGPVRRALGDHVHGPVGVLAPRGGIRDHPFPADDP